jgi:putative SOS response-associated peptidase YedK
MKDTEGNLLFMAGLYRETEEGREFVIITKDAYGNVTEIHDRMPVIMLPSEVNAYLRDDAAAREIIGRVPPELEFKAA